MDPQNDDENLPLLREWKIEATLSSDFKQQVWGRIALAQKRKSLLGEFLLCVENALPRPIPALTYASMLIAVGLFAGIWKGQEDASRLQHQLETRYVQSVDPYKAVSE